MENEDQIVDQIGELMQKLSPEKQAQVIATLSQFSGEAEEPMPEQTMSPEGGLTGKPAGY